MTVSTTKNEGNSSWLHIMVLCAAVMLAYIKIFHAGFIAWDDGEYVLHNKDIAGFGAEQISAWFSNFYIGNYHPLTMCSYAIDHLIGGQEPFMYHLTNLLIHSANAVILYLFVNRLQNNKLVGLFVALVFALHPVQTESVSWIAERKTVLCGFFYLLAMLQYADYVRVPSRKRFIVVVLLGISAMLSKGVGVGLPLSLLAVDIWLQRDMKSRKLWMEKLPLLFMSIIIGVVAIKAQAAEKALGMHAQDNVFNTIMFAADAYVQYIVRLFVPVNLSVIYPYPKEVGWVEYFCLAGTLCIIWLGVIAYQKGWNVLFGGFVFYTVNIVLVLQFVQFGECLMADRYLYLAGIGVIFPSVYYLVVWLQKVTKPVTMLIVWGAITVTFLFMTFLRNDIWLSDMNFFSSVVQTFPNSAVAQYSVGALYVRMGNYDEAETHLDIAVHLDPNNYKAWYNKGVLHMRQGNAMEALDAYNKCLSLKEYSKAYFSRAMLYEGTGKPELALPDIARVLEEQPGNARAYYIKADCLEQQGNEAGAIDNYSKAIEYEDTEPLFYVRRGLALAKNNHPAQAIGDLDKAVTLKSDDGEAYYYRGLIKYRAGKDPCDDLHNALKYGYRQAGDAVAKYCVR